MTRDARNEGSLRRLVRRLSVNVFTDCIHVLPHLACDREPGCWGYPSCVWLSVGWWRWTVQVALHKQPFRYQRKSHGRDHSVNENDNERRN